MNPFNLKKRTELEDTCQIRWARKDLAVFHAVKRLKISLLNLKNILEFSPC